MSEISLDVAAKENKTPLALTGNLYVHCVGLISPNGLEIWFGNSTILLRTRLKVFNQEHPQQHVLACSQHPLESCAGTS